MFRRVAASVGIAVVSFGLLAGGLRSSKAGEPGNPLIGGWRAENYHLRDGTEYPLLGQILFTEKNFNVLYIVVKEGKPQRGSGEGGDYTVEGNNVTFIHHYIASTPAEAIQGLKAQALRAFKWDKDLVEASTFKVDGEHMTLFMPSGNQLTWTRTSR